MLSLLEARAKDPLAGLARWSDYWQNWWHASRWRSASRRSLGARPRASSSGWKTVPSRWGPWEDWGVPELASYDGIVWYRTSFLLNVEQAAQRATLSLGPVDEVDTTWVNGKIVGYTSGAGTNRSLLARHEHAARRRKHHRRRGARHVHDGRDARHAWQRRLTLADGTADSARRRVEVRDRAFRNGRATARAVGIHRRPDHDLQRDDRAPRALHASRCGSGIRANRTPKTRAATRSS